MSEASCFPSSPLLLFKSWGFNFPSHQNGSAFNSPRPFSLLFCSPRLAHPHHIRATSPSRGLRGPQGAGLSLIYDCLSSAFWGKSLYQDEKPGVGVERGFLFGCTHSPAYSRSTYTYKSSGLHVSDGERNCQILNRDVWFALHLFSYAFKDFHTGWGGRAILNVEIRSEGTWSADILGEMVSTC